MSENEVKKPIRQYPNNFDAEQYVLCCFLIDGQAFDTFGKNVTEDYFYAPKHKVIYRAMQSLAKAGTVINVITVNDLIAKENAADIQIPTAYKRR